MQGSSPYKKPGPHGIICTGTGSPSNAKLRSGPGTVEETTRLQVKSFTAIPKFKLFLIYFNFVSSRLIVLKN